MEKSQQPPPKSNDTQQVTASMEETAEDFHILTIRHSECLNESIANCQMPVCDDADIECVCSMVNATICEAERIVESDPRQLFCYKYPQTQSYFNIRKPEENTGDSDPSNTSDFMRTWMTIRNFDYSNIIAIIRDYISQWQLSPNTKCIVLANSQMHEVEMKGRIYFVDAHFSRPTQRCPNPLAVAKVRFVVTVSNVLAKYYPVMITYRFEGYRTLYYAVGSRAITTNTFQRFFIDSILHTKLSFYAALSECRHGSFDKPKHAMDSLSSLN